MAKQELARFLRDRREKLHPADIGLPTDQHRRTLGLRREEVAEPTPMSVDYYARLEQARGPRPSPRIPDALTSVFRLTPAERTHLFRLAGTDLTPPAGPARRVRAQVAALLRRIPDTAAIVTDVTDDVIAFNPLAGALLGVEPGAEPNLARRRFLGRPYESSSAAEFADIVERGVRPDLGHQSGACPRSPQQDHLSPEGGTADPHHRGRGHALRAGPAPPAPGRLRATVVTAG